MSAIKTNPHTRNRRLLDPSKTPTGTPIVPTITPSGINVSLDYGQQIVWNGDTPDFAVASRNATATALTAPTVIRISYDGTVATKAYVQGSYDPAVRNASGGYVQPTAGTFP